MRENLFISLFASLCFCCLPGVSNKSECKKEKRTPILNISVLYTIDGAAMLTGAVSASEVAALAHERGDHAVELGPLEALDGSLPGAELPEVLYRKPKSTKKNGTRRKRELKKNRGNEK